MNNTLGNIDKLKQPSEFSGEPYIDMEGVYESMDNMIDELTQKVYGADYPYTYKNLRELRSKVGDEGMRYLSETLAIKIAILEDKVKTEQLAHNKDPKINNKNENIDNKVVETDNDDIVD
jgi:hypothetical protein